MDLSNSHQLLLKLLGKKFMANLKPDWKHMNPLINLNITKSWTYRVLLSKYSWQKEKIIKPLDVDISLQSLSSIENYIK